MNSQQLDLLFRNSPTLSGDKSLQHVIHALNEENQDLKRAVVECAKVCDQLADHLNKVLQINVEMKNRIDQQFRPEDDQAPSTRMIGDAD